MNKPVHCKNDWVHLTQFGHLSCKSSIVLCNSGNQKWVEVIQTFLQCGVMFQQFRQYVAGVCNDGSVQNKTTVVEIFRTVREKKCWDLNGDPYNLLLSIVRGVEDTELTASVQKERDAYYTEYFVSTNVADHIFQCGAKQPKFESDFVKLSMKLDEVNIHKCSIAHLIDFWTEVKRCVKLPDLLCAVGY